MRIKCKEISLIYNKRSSQYSYKLYMKFKLNNYNNNIRSKVKNQSLTVSHSGYLSLLKLK